MPEEIKVCPECDSPGITQRHHSRGERYRCKECAARFDRPRVRERYRCSPDSTGSELVAKLARMDADEVSGD